MPSQPKPRNHPVGSRIPDREAAMAGPVEAAGQQAAAVEAEQQVEVAGQQAAEEQAAEEQAVMGPAEARERKARRVPARVAAMGAGASALWFRLRLSQRKGKA